MKIIELEICNFRGIRHLKLQPGGRNFLISGPNGSGKSAIVDAVDFLLTGEISRLKGKGTRGINLKKHAPHVDSQPEDSWVKAQVKLPAVEEPVEIKRSVSNNQELLMDDSYLEVMEPILDLARRGQHILTRREILNFVTAEASTRAGQVQNLLKLDTIEEHRKKLVKVRNILQNEFKSAENSLNRALGEVSVTIGQEEVTPEKLMGFVNNQRTVLGGDPLAELWGGDLLAEPNRLKEDLDHLAEPEPHQLKEDLLQRLMEDLVHRLKEDLLPPALRPESKVNPKILEQDLQKIANITSDKDIPAKEAELRVLALKIYSNPHLLGAVKRLKLTRLGLELLTDELSDDRYCPLCERTWKPSELKQHLEERLELYQDAQKDLERIEKLSQDILNCVHRLEAALREVSKALKEWGLQEEYPQLETWSDELESLERLLEDPLDELLGDSLDGLLKGPLEGLLEDPDLYPKVTREKMAVLCAPENLSFLEEIGTLAREKSPEPSLEQTAWDQLTRLEENLKTWQEIQKDRNSSYGSYQRSEALLDAFLKAREEVLNQLYNGIKDRFVELYRELHLDEADFDATLTTQGAGVDFQVDFHGRGEHPPNALHSEGHQDSMGICLYLALAERLTQGYIDLIILDDVMMSVDAPHRREICHLLADFFKGRQFFITTHDQTWARQLQSEGVVRSRDRIELSNWTIESGPSVNYMGDIWEPIEKDLRENDVPSAAAKLRRGSEEYFSMVCDSIQAPVKFRFSGQYEMGDLLSGAISGYNKHLKQAKNAAQSWKNSTEMEKLKEIDEYSKKVFSRINMERWALNPAVHYNQWADFTPQDFTPVVESFHDLFLVFQCEKCETLLHLVMNGANAESLKCNCGSVNLNLKEK